MIRNLLFSVTSLLLLLTSPLAAQETRTIQGNLSDGDRSFEDGSLIDVYAISLSDKQSVKASLQSDDFDSELIFVNPDGKFGSRASGKKGQSAFGISTRAFAPKVGKFEIIVAAKSPGEGGNYTLELTSTKQILDVVLGPDGNPMEPEDFASQPATPAGGGDMQKNPEPAKPSEPETPESGEPVKIEVAGLGEIELSPRAFIDQALSQSFGQKMPANDGSRDMSQALGAPDGKQFVLGKGGEAVWEFTDNVMLDKDGPDLLVWERNGKETFQVWVSADGYGFQNIGEFSGEGPIPIDLNNKFPAGEKLRFVKLIDTSLESNSWPGADIDAIAAIHSGEVADQSGGGMNPSPAPVDVDLGGGDKVSLEAGSAAYVDEVVDINSGTAAPPDGKDPKGAIGAPDYQSGAEKTYHSLYRNGGAAWKFSDNVLVDGEGVDLLVWDAYPMSAEKCKIAISPSSEGGWIELGEFTAARPIAIDIGPKVEAGAVFRFVRIMDAAADEGDQWATIDIDAIAAVHGSADGSPIPEPEKNADALEFETADGKTITLNQGKAAFVDETMSQDFGDRMPKENSRDPDSVLGAPDYKGEDSDGTYFSLGAKGNAIWRFTDNALVNGPGDDLLIFEIGSYKEPVEVSISTDGNDWIFVGEHSGGTRAIDLGEEVPTDVLFHYIRLVDLGSQGGQWPGADIDAIAAIHGKPSSFEPGKTPGGSGSNAIMKPDGQNTKPGSDSKNGNDNAPMVKGAIKARITFDHVFAQRTVAEAGKAQHLQIRVQENTADGSVFKKHFPRGQKNAYLLINGGTLEGAAWPGIEIPNEDSVSDFRSPEIETAPLKNGDIATYVFTTAHSMWRYESDMSKDDREFYGFPLSDSWTPANKTGNNDWDLQLRSTLESRLRHLEYGFGGQQPHTGAFAVAVGNFDGSLEVVCVGINWLLNGVGLNDLFYPSLIRGRNGEYEAKVSDRTVAPGESTTFQILGKGPILKENMNLRVNDGEISWNKIGHVLKENAAARREIGENIFTVTVTNPAL